MLTQFHEKAQKVIVIAESLAFDLGHSSVGSEHLLLSILKMKDCTLTKLLKQYQVNDEIIYEDMIRLFGKKDVQPFYMEYSEVVKKILEDAVQMSEAQNEEKVSLNMMCIALLNQKESVAVELLNKYHIPFQSIKKELSEEKAMLHELNTIHELTNYNQLVEKQKRHMIGRQKELEQLFLTLCKKGKNNVLLIGKAGVGKTALVEKLALEINQHHVPQALQNKVIYELSLASIVAGTKYRGEFEDKFKKIIQKVIQAKDAILFIDEIHNLIGAGGAEGAIDASNILKPFLARRDLTIIGATTIEEYYKYFEKDQAMNRRFSIVKVNENTPEETLEILQGLKQQYEDYHHMTINEQCLKDVISLCDEYLPQRVFPDKALDVLDLSCVKAHFLEDTTLQKKHIEKVLEEITGLTIHQNISSQQLYQNLIQNIFGQDQALQQLSESIASMSQYPHQKKPLGIYLFLGKSGIGKTKTAQVLANVLQRHFIKLDMSEYSEPFTVNKIIGSPPGYVGYDNHTSLLHELTLYPHSILLLDEIEKAHPQVLHLFLQVFDEGYLKDSQHRMISFRNTIILMTTNVTQQNQSHVGFKKLEENPQPLKDYFSEEFLNRIDEIILYHSLQKEDFQNILTHQSPMPLSQDMIQEILKDYNYALGARPLLNQMKKYLMTHQDTH